MSDSLPSLFRHFSDPYSTHKLISRIHILLHTLRVTSRTIVFWWAPGYTSIPGNEKVDEEARLPNVPVSALIFTHPAPISFWLPIGALKRHGKLIGHHSPSTPTNSPFWKTPLTHGLHQTNPRENMKLFRPAFASGTPKSHTHSLNLPTPPSQLSPLRPRPSADGRAHVHLLAAFPSPLQSPNKLPVQNLTHHYPKHIALWARTACKIEENKIKFFFKFISRNFGESLSKFQEAFSLNFHEFSKLIRIYQINNNT